MEDRLNERARHLLRVLVETYIRHGQPVSSRTLARESGLDISPATVRNVMAELDALGLVTSPHTSAGRVPTDKGYRLFVDALLTIEPMGAYEVRQLKQVLEQGATLQGLAESVSDLLSGATSMAGVVLLPRRDRLTLRHIEFIPLSDTRVLAVLVVNEQEIQNVVIRTERKYTPSELEQASNYLNTMFSGRDVAEVRGQLLAELRDTKERMDRASEAAVRMAEQLFESDSGGGSEDAVVVSGHTNLLEFQELYDLDRLRVLFKAFHEKRQMLHLLDKCVSSQGVKILIGEESGHSVLNDCSLVTSTYKISDTITGVLGVIGPTRMAYRRIIPLVDMTARLVSATLNRHH